jgi:outer membrane protein assembly factor BamB
MKRAMVLVIIFLFFNMTIVASMSEDAEHSSSTRQNVIYNQKIINDDPMESQWPVMAHDTHHTGLCPYNTAENPLVEKWRFPGDGWVYSSPVIDWNGTIYFGASKFFAVYSNGTLKWKTKDWMWIESAPAIDDNGIIYVGTADSPNFLYAFYPNGTVKWKYPSDNICSSPIINNDGIIYFGEDNGNLIALYPNGTLKWSSPNIYSVYSSPAIGDDGIIYCTSWYGPVYALYPDNGTVKWQFPTGGNIKANPSIADDGTIYVSSWDDYLYALYPNGTMKWKVNTRYGCSSNPSIGPDGTIYVAHADLYAVNPDGTVKWIFPLGDLRDCSFAAPAISAEGIIYIGANIDIDHGVGGELIVVNPDGTERWRSGSICNEGIVSSPAIAEDGTVYIGCLNDYEKYPGGFTSRGYLHAFGPGDIKKIDLLSPKSGHFYFLGYDLGRTLRGRTMAIGDVPIKVNVSSVSEIESVDVLLDNELCYTASSPPFEWTLDKRAYGYYTLRVVGRYKGGCESTARINMGYLHL